MPVANGTVVYVGAFQLPDGNAAAHRVMANALIFRELGLDVVFIEVGKVDQSTEEREIEVNGFRVLRLSLRQGRWRNVAQAVGHPGIFPLLGEQEDLRAVIAYNYPSPALLRLRGYCRGRGVPCLADITEWYQPRLDSLANLFRALDSAVRMRIVHPRLDGAIVISRYMADFYEGCLDVVKLPPLVDARNQKWSAPAAVDKAAITFIYAGSPSARKERLDVVVETFQRSVWQKPVCLEIYGVTAEEYRVMYGMERTPSNGPIRFHGRVAHSEVLSALARADYALVVRDESRNVLAGFPTKFVESVTASTPVIASWHPDVIEYIDRYACGLVTTLSTLDETISVALSDGTRVAPDRTAFDYRRYLEPVAEFFDKVGL
ncbi:MAG: glycosyltransferase [Nigerium sp.]|nr:glycosyltransferase [Nigerium sp.]